MGHLVLLKTLRPKRTLPSLFWGESSLQNHAHSFLFEGGETEELEVV